MLSLSGKGPAVLIGLGFTRSEAARLLAVHRSTLWRYLTGRETPPARVESVVVAVVALADRRGQAAALARVRRHGVTLQVKPTP